MGKLKWICKGLYMALQNMSHLPTLPDELWEIIGQYKHALEQRDIDTMQLRLHDLQEHVLILINQVETERVYTTQANDMRKQSLHEADRLRGENIRLQIELAKLKQQHNPPPGFAGHDPNIDANPWLQNL